MKTRLKFHTVRTFSSEAEWVRLITHAGQKVMTLGFTLKLLFVALGVGRRSKYVHEGCEGCAVTLLPQRGMWGTISEKGALAVWVQVFMRCEVNHYSDPKPSAAFPERKEFSLNSRGKYLDMQFYDLKSVLETDLSPLLADKRWVERVTAINRTARLDLILYVQKDERYTTVGFKIRHTKKRLTLPL